MTAWIELPWVSNWRRSAIGAMAMDGIIPSGCLQPCNTRQLCWGMSHIIASPTLNSNTSLLLSDETVSTVPSPLDSLLDSTGTYGDETGASNSEKVTKCQSSHRFAPHFSSVFGRRG